VLQTEYRVQLQLGPVESCPVVDSMLIASIYLNFLGCPVYRPCLVVGYPTLDVL
jgi:hypothetical protein